MGSARAGCVVPTLGEWRRACQPPASDQNFGYRTETDGNADLAVDVCRQELLKYTGTDCGAFAEEMLDWARSRHGSLRRTFV
jgi:hypothetical protein